MRSLSELVFCGLLGVVLALVIAPPTAVVQGTHLTLHEARVRSSVPLTEENFERAKFIKSEEVVRKYPIGTGPGPIRPKFITNGVDGPQTKVTNTLSWHMQTIT